MTLLRPDLGFATVEYETTYDTDPATDPLPIILTEQPDPPTPTRNTVERTRVKATGGRTAHTVVKSHVEFEFTTALAPMPFSDGATPQVAPILKGSGMSESTSGSTTSAPVKASYSPDRRALGSYTLKLYIPDKDSETDYSQIVLTGCRSNISIDGSPDSELTMSVSGQARYSEWTEIQDLSSEEPALSDYPSGTTFTFQDYSFSLGSVNTNIEGWSFDPSFEVQQVSHTSGTERVKEIHLDTAGKEPGGSVDPLATSVGASGDSLDKHRSASESAMDLNLAEGASDEKEWQFDAPAVQLTEVSFSEADAYYRYDDSFVCNETTTGDDDFALIWKRQS